MTGHAAVGVDDDLATGQTAVTHRAADDETTGRVDEVFGVLVDPLYGSTGLMIFAHRFHQILVADGFGVLGRQHHGIHTDDLAGVVVGEGQLALGIRTQPRQGAVLAHFSLTLHQQVRGDGAGISTSVSLVA